MADAVLSDLVVNHTSDRHPWFRSARSSRNSPYRDFYVWRDEPGKQEAPIFPDKEKSIWTYDEKAGQYCLHRFYKHQPDLNITNPAVRDEIAKTVGFWLELGLSGFRVDAVPFLIESLGEEDLPWHPHAHLRELRGFLSRRSGEAIMLGEVNLPHKDQLRFFGGEDGDELTMQFDFITMQSPYLSLARRDAGPVAAALQARPGMSRDCQWATFVRNHDELTPLTAHGLIDEYRLAINPVALGGGTPLFPAGTPRIEFDLADTRVFGSGIVELRCTPRS